ncbi:MAG: DUF222 domain-containing protein [Micrococcaceae bacterium]
MSAATIDGVHPAAAPDSAADSAAETAVESWFEGLSLADAFRSLEQGLRVVSRRLSAPEAREEFTPFTSSTTSRDTNSDEPDGGSLPDLLRSGETLTRLVSGVQSRLDGFTTEVFHRPRERAALLGLPEKGKVGFRNPGEFLQDTTNISRYAAQQRARHAEHFQPHSPAQNGHDDQKNTGQAGRLARLLPGIARGLQELWLGVDRLAVITRAIDKIRTAAQQNHVPSHDVDDYISASDAFLVEAARNATFGEFSAEVSRWRNSVLMNLSPHDDLTDGERDASLDRALTFVRRDGDLFLWQVATTQDGHEMLSLVESAANSPRARSAKSCAETADETDQDAPVVADDRSRTQRAHDGFMGVLTSGLRGVDNGLPDQGGARPQLVVTTGLIPMLRMAHHAGLLPETFDPELLKSASSQELLISAGYSGPSGAGILRRMLCDADILPVVLGTEGEVLDAAKRHRLFSTAQRKALVARDGGCAVPGCTFPSAWCESHHITAWKNGGPTTIDNGVLLCTHHHHAVHEGHWHITMDRGVPWFTPTTKLRPYFTHADRKPARNTYWRDHPRRFLTDEQPGLNAGHRSAPELSASPMAPGPHTPHHHPVPADQLALLSGEECAPPSVEQSAAKQSSDADITHQTCQFRESAPSMVHRLKIPAAADSDDAAARTA